MLRAAFSTIACPEWTLEKVASAAAEMGWAGVELRTFDDGSARLACDPSLTAGEKVMDIFAGAGVEIAGLAASTRFDEVVDPPVMGLVFGDNERSVREAKRAVALARGIGAPAVRVFAFEGCPLESRKSALRRIVERLKKVADDARNTGVRIALENGGGFPRAADVREIIDLVGSPHLNACYALAPTFLAGEGIEAGIDALDSGSDLLSVRIKDLRDGAPCPLGDGDLPCGEVVKELARRGFGGWVLYEWDRLWLPDITPAERALSAAARMIAEWAGEAHQSTGRRMATARA